MRSNLDVWAIQDNPEELETAINNVKKCSKNNILFSNCLSTLLLGDVSVDVKKFDTMLYAEDSDVLIILMKDGKVDADDIRSYLNGHHISYNEVVFNSKEEIADLNALDGVDDILIEDDNLKKELWFAREVSVVSDAVRDSIEKNYSQCIYYPNVVGNLELQYLSSLRKLHSVEGRDFQGVVEFPDKMILLINGENVDNVREEEIYRVLDKNNIGVLVDFDVNIASLSSSQKVKVKK